MQDYKLKNKDIKILIEAVKNSYFAFDREDWCENAVDVCKGQKKCNGCICYDNLIKAFRIAKNI